MNQSRSEQRYAESGERRSGAGVFEFLMINDVLEDAGAAPSIFLGPVDSHPAAFVQLAMPLNASLPIACCLIREWLAHWRRIPEITLKPRAEVGPKDFIFGGIVEVHVTDFILSRCW